MKSICFLGWERYSGYLTYGVDGFEPSTDESAGQRFSPIHGRHVSHEEVPLTFDFSDADVQVRTVRGIANFGIIRSAKFDRQSGYKIELYKDPEMTQKIAQFEV